MKMLFEKEVVEGMIAEIKKLKQELAGYENSNYILELDKEDLQHRIDELQEIIDNNCRRVRWDGLLDY